MGAPQRLRTFASGITVVQSGGHSDERVCAAIAKLVAPSAAANSTGSKTMQNDGSSSSSSSALESSAFDALNEIAGLGPGIGPSDVARALGCPLAIAAEHLLTAEARCVVCRDDGPEGLRFYRNFFSDAAIMYY